MKIAVIGAGLFGSTIAISLNNNGNQVELFEKNKDILASASGINQYRLHRGYHYPRSLATAISSKNAEPFFCKEYNEALFKHADHFYCIAAKNSKITAKQFLDFCDKCDLEYEKANLVCINPESIQLTVKVRENLIDPIVLRRIIKKKIQIAKVNLHLNTVFTNDKIQDFDYIINCTYANLNGIFENQLEYKTKYQFELCEKPVLSLPKIFKNKSIVIMDGPFMCIDPYANTGNHVMGNVSHAIHISNKGYSPNIPEQFLPLLNKGIIKNPSITNFGKFIESASVFLPEVKKAEHIGSMYTIRTVLPDVDSTDERPTLVSRINEKIINVFSGKLGNCVEVSEKVIKLLNGN